MKYIVFLYAAFLSQSVYAELTHFIMPEWQRGIKGSAYLEWDNFVNPQKSILNQPDKGFINFSSSLLRETTGTGFRTGTENIYSLYPQSFVLNAIPNTQQGPSLTSNKLEVLFQIRTIGGALNPSTIKLNNQVGKVETLFKGIDSGSFGSYQVTEYAIKWTLNSYSALNIGWEFSKAHTSLTNLSLDVFGEGQRSIILDFPDQFKLPPIPGSHIFNKDRVTIADFMTDNQQAINNRSFKPSPQEVPIPSTIFLFMSGVMALFYKVRNAN